MRKLIRAAISLDSNPMFRSTSLPSTSSYLTESGSFSRSSGVTGAREERVLIGDTSAPKYTRPDPDTTCESRPFARHDLVVLALADPAERVVLAERVAAEAVPREDAAEVGVAGEDDAEHVVHFPLHPLGPGPHAGDAVELEAGVALLHGVLVADVVAGGGVARRVEEDPEPQPVVVGDAGQAVVHAEAVLGAGVVEVVDAVELRE